MEAGAYAFRALRLVERGGGACRLAVSYVCVSFTFGRTALGFKPLAVGLVGLPRRNALQLSAVVHTQSDAHGRGSSLAVVAAETTAAPCLAADGSVVAPFGRKCGNYGVLFYAGSLVGNRQTFVRLGVVAPGPSGRGALRDVVSGGGRLGPGVHAVCVPPVGHCLGSCMCHGVGRPLCRARWPTMEVAAGFKFLDICHTRNRIGADANVAFPLLPAGVGH